VAGVADSSLSEAAVGSTVVDSARNVSVVAAWQVDRQHSAVDHHSLATELVARRPSLLAVLVTDLRLPGGPPVDGLRSLDVHQLLADHPSPDARLSPAGHRSQENRSSVVEAHKETVAHLARRECTARNGKNGRKLLARKVDVQKVVDQSEVVQKGVARNAAVQKAISHDEDRLAKHPPSLLRKPRLHSLWKLPSLN
jgi:hypothetical protein